MPYLDLYCKSCDQEVSVFCDGDNAMICPECRDVDNFKEIELDEIIWDEELNKADNEYQMMPNLEDERLTQLATKPRCK